MQYSISIVNRIANPDSQYFWTSINSFDVKKTLKLVVYAGNLLAAIDCVQKHKCFPMHSLVNASIQYCGKLPCRRGSVLGLRCEGSCFEFCVIHSFIHSFIYSFIHSFIHPPTHPPIHPSLHLPHTQTIPARLLLGVWTVLYFDWIGMNTTRWFKVTSPRSRRVLSCLGHLDHHTGDIARPQPFIKCLDPGTNKARGRT